MNGFYSIFLIFLYQLTHPFVQNLFGLRAWRIYMPIPCVKIQFFCL